MIYEELKIQFDLNDSIDVLKSIGKKTKDGDWFVVCDEGDCHLFNENGNEIDIKKIKTLNEDLIPKDIKKIIVPNSIKIIRHSTFYDCKDLISIVIPDSIEYIKNYTFYKCVNLTSVIIPDSIKNIEVYAFARCENLTSINISDSVKSIGSFAFINCKNLTSITIPDLIETVGYDALYNCKNLKSLTFKNKTIEQVKSMNFYPWGIKDESIIKCIN